MNEEPKFHKDEKPTTIVILIVAAAIATALLCLLILPHIGSIPPGYFGGF